MNTCLGQVRIKDKIEYIYSGTRWIRLKDCKRYIQKVNPLKGEPYNVNGIKIDENFFKV